MFSIQAPRWFLCILLAQWWNQVVLKGQEIASVPSSRRPGPWSYVQSATLSMLQFLVTHVTWAALSQSQAAVKNLGDYRTGGIWPFSQGAWRQMWRAAISRWTHKGTSSGWLEKWHSIADTGFGAKAWTFEGLFLLINIRNISKPCDMIQKLKWKPNQIKLFVSSICVNDESRNP